MNASLLETIKADSSFFELHQGKPFSAKWLIERFAKTDVAKRGYGFDDLALVLAAKGKSLSAGVDWPNEDEYRDRTLGAFDLDGEAALEAVSIPGLVQTSIGSALLAWARPDRFAVIDFHSWRTLVRFGCRSNERKSFARELYPPYLETLRSLSLTLKTTPQQVDVWLYSFSRCTWGVKGAAE